MSGPPAPAASICSQDMLELDDLIWPLLYDDADLLPKPDS